MVVRAGSMWSSNLVNEDEGGGEGEEEEEEEGLGCA